MELDLDDINFDEEEAENNLKINVEELLAPPYLVIEKSVVHVLEKLEIELAKTDIENIISILVKTYELLKQDVYLYLSQVVSTAMGLIRHLCSREVGLMPGALIYDDVGSGKTLKMLLILSAILIACGDTGICIVICKEAVQSNWVQQGRTFFKTAPVQSMSFHDQHLIARIAVVSFTSFSVSKLTGKRTRRNAAGAGAVRENKGGAQHIFPRFMYEEKYRILSVTVDEANNITAPGSTESNRVQSIGSLKADSVWLLTGTSTDCKGDDITNRLVGIVKDITQYHDIVEEISSFMYHVRKEESSIDIEPCIIEVRFKPIEATMINLMDAAIASKDKAAGFQILSHYYFLPWKLYDIRDDSHLYIDNDDSSLSKTALVKRAMLSRQLQLCTSQLLDTGHVVRIDNDNESSRTIYVGPYFHAMLYDDLYGIVTVMSRTMDKIIVFTEYNDEIRLLEDVLGSLFMGQVESISGSSNSLDKSNAIASFTRNPSKRIILVNKKVGEAGLNLQVANWVYMLSIDSNPAKVEQCLGRAARQGQTKTVHWVSVTGSTRSEENALIRQLNVINNQKEFKEDDPQLSLIEVQNQDMTKVNTELKCATI
jgi:Helicase conserved C-terminal domain/SNF2-related domain